MIKAELTLSSPFRATLLAAALAATAASTLAACSDDGSDARADAGSGAADASASAAAEAGAGTDGGSGAALTPAIWVRFDPALGQFPEGLALKGGEAYVSLATTGAILRVAADGTVSPFGSVPVPAGFGGGAGGLIFDPSGQLLVTVASLEGTPKAGVYRFPTSGGAGALLTASTEMKWPNGLAYDGAGALFVSDSNLGTIFKVAADGSAAAWASGPALAPDKATCTAGGPAFDIGINGIAVTPSAIWGVNTTKASVVRVPINPDGSAGAIETVIPSDCDRLAGADGVALDGETLYIAVNGKKAIATLDTRTRAFATVAKDGALDFPASVVIGTNAGKKTLFISNFAILSGATGNPGVLRAPLE